ncbi:hypothetical protein [Thermus sp. LT1-2-5]|uniref:hypothetical protein n=1 Tax=Thermus sp. LT1-2-5 TaxID=3026935 RepID=UPI003365612A
MSGKATNGHTPKVEQLLFSSFRFSPDIGGIVSPLPSHLVPKIMGQEEFTKQWEQETATASPKVIFATARASATASASGQARVVGGEGPMEERKDAPTDAGQVALQVALDISRRMDAMAESLRQDFRAIVQELREDNKALREEVKREVSELRQEIREVRSDVNNRIQQSQNIILIVIGVATIVIGGATILLTVFSLMQR